MRRNWNSWLQIRVHSKSFAGEGYVYSNPCVAFDAGGLCASGIKMTSLASDILKVDSGGDNFLGSLESPFQDYIQLRKEQIANLEQAQRHSWQSLTNHRNKVCLRHSLVD